MKPLPATRKAGTLKAGLLLIFALIATCVRAEKVATLPVPAGYVDDYAGVLTDLGKLQLTLLCDEVHEKTRAQIFFVTIKSLEGAPIESFANDLFHTWKIGEKKTDRGVLVLLSIGDHKRRIEIGYGLEGILPDGKVGRIGRDMEPALKAADYDQAAMTGVKEIAEVIAEDSKVTLSAAQLTVPNDRALADPSLSGPDNVTAPSGEGGRVSSSNFSFFFWLVFTMGLFGIIMLSALFGTRRRFGSRDSGSGGSSGFFSTSDSSSSSSSSSDSSSSSSSSSDSFSGGDGGDSGGGGASGDW